MLLRFRSMILANLVALRHRWLTEFVYRDIALDKLKQYAIGQLLSYKNTQTVLLNQAKLMKKWLVGSLLLLNGGAAFTALDAAISHRNPAGLAWLFASGIVVAVLNGWLVHAIVARHLAFFDKACNYWALVERIQKQVPDEEEVLWYLSRKTWREGIILPIPAAVSIAVFGWAYHSLITTYHLAN